MKSKNISLSKIDTQKLIEIESLAKEKMNIHGVSDWSFAWDNAVNRHGCCHWNKKIITLSKPIALKVSHESTLNTILHEIAHAICPQHEQHGELSKRTARELGCSGERCAGESAMIAKKWFGTCPNCQRTVTKHRRRNISCGKCCRKFNGGRWTERYRFEWVEA